MAVMRSMYFLLGACILVACQKERSPEPNKPLYDTASMYSLQHISYGSHAQQSMDIYLPAHRSATSTKTFILVHGGGWVEGDKAEFTETFNALKSLYPDHAIANINYVLATANSKAYPNQINDIKAAVAALQSGDYTLSSQYFFIGASAGAHLSLLYSYAHDPQHEVKGVCNVIGPTDFTDTAYLNHTEYEPLYQNLLGVVSYAENPALFREVSPAKQVTPGSPPTISFYGAVDPLIPVSQMHLLHTALEANGVPEQATLYAGEGHGGWSQQHNNDLVLKLTAFIDQYFR